MKFIKAFAGGVAAVAFAAPAAAAAATAAPAQNYKPHDVVADAFKPDRQVCNTQGVCCTLDALGNIADCLISGSPGSPGNPGQYSDPYPTNARTHPVARPHRPSPQHTLGTLITDRRRRGEDRAY